jgi:ribosomal protein S4
MRRYSKYKVFSRLKKVVFFYPKKIKKFKHSKWKAIKLVDTYGKRGSFLNFSLQVIPEDLRKRTSSYLDKLTIRREISQLYDTIFKTSSLKNSIVKLKKLYNNNTIDVLIHSILKFEFRLDVLLFRAGFFSSIFEAKDFINQKKISVNGSFKNYNYIVKEGDIITFLKKKEISESNITPCYLQSFLEIDYVYLNICVIKNYQDLTIEDISLITSENSIGINQINSLYYKI